ncbi:MAG: Gfo/Idh/MocA family oxidoreductase [Asticcacaulis sp.]
MSGFNIDRRSLFLGAGMLPLIGSTAMAATPKAEGQPLPGRFDMPDPPAKRMNWAVVGLGTFAVGQMMPGFVASSHAKMTAFVSGSPQKAHDLGAAYGVSKFYDYNNFDQIANDKDIDCVYIALPVGLHAEYTIRALKAGKHVLCEKPMASTVAECEAMVAAAKAANKQLGVAYRVHFEPNNMNAIQRLRDGEIGDLRYFSGETGFVVNPSYPPHKWRLEKGLGGGGSMYDIGIYALNAALWAVNEAPTSVTAVYSMPANDPRFKEVEGGVDWRLRFPSGISAQGSSSYCWTYATRQKFFATKGSISMDPASEYNQITTILQRDGMPPANINSGSPTVQFSAQIDAFCVAAAANKPHRTPGEMGLRDIRIIQAMYQSADADGQIVKL